MVHITIDGPSQDFELDVHSTDVVDPVLEIYSEDLDNPQSQYYEPAFIIGEAIPFDKGKTFAECGIEHGDTLYHLLGLKKYVYIRHELAIEDITIPVSISCGDTVEDVIEKLLSDSGDCITRMSVTQLDLRLGDEILDKSKTFADYKVKNDEVIQLVYKRYTQVSIGVPKYTEMELVLFEPGDTVADVKDEVEKMMPHFEWTAGIRESYPVPLRGVVNIREKGTIACVYLNVFRDNMEMFVGEYNTGDEPIDLIGCRISGESTFNDVHRIIRTGGRYDEWIEICGPIRWPKPYTFDSDWTLAFSRQFYHEPLSTDTSMTLFFFPLRVENVQLDDVSPYISVAELADLFCKRKLRLEGVERSIYHPRAGDFLSPHNFLYEDYNLFVSDGESSSIILTKPEEQCDPENWWGTDMHITIHVRYDSCILSFEMKSTNTINTLGDEIEDVLQVPFYMQRLFFNGKAVQCNCTFQEEGIGHNSTVDLLCFGNFEMLKFSPLNE